MKKGIWRRVIDSLRIVDDVVLSFVDNRIKYQWSNSHQCLAHSWLSLSYLFNEWMDPYLFDFERIDCDPIYLYI